MLGIGPGMNAIVQTRPISKAFILADRIDIKGSM